MIRMVKRVFVGFFFAFSSLHADEGRLYRAPGELLFDSVKATIADREKPEEILFFLERKAELRDNKVYASNVFTHPTEGIWAREDLVFTDGAPEAFTQDRPSQKIKCEMRVEGKKLRFTRWEDGRIVKTDSEEIDDLLLIPDQIVPFAHQNWELLMKGETLKFRLALPCRLETIGFKLFHDSDSVVDAKPVHVFRLKPRSFIIAALAPVIEFRFDKAPPHVLVQYIGHILPQRRGKKPGDFDDYPALMRVTEVISKKP